LETAPPVPVGSPRAPALKQTAALPAASRTPLTVIPAAVPRPAVRGDRIKIMLRGTPAKTISKNTAGARTADHLNAEVDWAALGSSFTDTRRRQLRDDCPP